MKWTSIFVCSFALLSCVDESTAFAPTDFGVSQRISSLTELSAAGGKKKRRRKDRKQPPGATAPDPIKVSQEKVEGLDEGKDDLSVEDAATFDLKQDDIAKGSAPLPDIKDSVKVEERAPEEMTKEDISTMQDIAQFEFKSDDMLKGVQDDEKSSEPTQTVDSSAIPLPSFQDSLKKKQMEKELARMEEEKEMSKPKIKRSDKEAFRKLLEQQPFADADDSFFEEEDYTIVSALLGEGAKPFLKIPSGPLQVGHFIGALGIVLMAFIEYPGFPLTNLPTPLRGALQGGLGTVYAINLVLAILSIFKAGERGQPVPLWFAKTFSVGGLAYDQLTQLPTLEQIEKANSVKGARAVKKNKR